MAGDGIQRAREASLARLGTDYLDFYLLHCPNGIADLSGVVATFGDLLSRGKIRGWRVSNFNVSDMERLLHVPHGDGCASNQVPYAIEHDLLPWCERHGMPVMAYSPLALAWTIRSGKVIAIPESGNVTHVRENAVALSIVLTSEELQTLDAAHPPPGR